MHGIEHRIVRHGGPALAHLAAQARLYQDPFRNVVNSGWDADLRESARERGVTMLLTGELGNLTLTAGGAYNLGDLLAQGRWGDWWACAVASWPGDRLRSILANSFERWIPRKLTGAIERRLHGLPWERELTFVLDAWYSRVTASRPSSPRLPDSYHERFDAIAAFDSGCVRKAALAETGTDVRDPLIDRRVVEFSLSLPPEQLFAGGVASPLARMALRDRVPPDLLRKRIRGHQSADWHERFLPADAQRLAAEISQSPVARELIDFEKVQKAIDRWPTTNLAGNATSLRYVHFLPMTFAAGLLMIEMDCEGWPELRLGR
jgi:asparagine synthase (glutamine-hydrolysing)